MMHLNIADQEKLIWKLKFEIVDYECIIDDFRKEAEIAEKGLIDLNNQIKNSQKLMVRGVAGDCLLLLCADVQGYYFCQINRMLQGRKEKMEIEHKINLYNYHKRICQEMIAIHLTLIETKKNTIAALVISIQGTKREERKEPPPIRPANNNILIISSLFLMFILYVLNRLLEGPAHINPQPRF